MDLDLPLRDLLIKQFIGMWLKVYGKAPAIHTYTNMDNDQLVIWIDQLKMIHIQESVQ